MAVVITGNNTPTAGGITYGDGTTYANTAAGTSGQPIVSGGAGAPVFRPYTLPASDGSASQVLQTNGSGVLSFATASSLAAATQAEMEAASSNTVAATPSNTNFHPGVAKAWLVANGNGLTILVSRNITSITDSGTGVLTVTIATDFSSTDYVITASVAAPGGNQKFVDIGSGGDAPTAGVFMMRCTEPSVGLRDPAFYYVSCFGDQA